MPPAAEASVDQTLPQLSLASVRRCLWLAVVQWIEQAQDSRSVQNLVGPTDFATRTELATVHSVGCRTGLATITEWATAEQLVAGQTCLQTSLLVARFNCQISGHQLLAIRR